MPDYQRLQTTLDEITQSVEWAAGWIEYLEENEVRGVGTSDLEILKAELAGCASLPTLSCLHVSATHSSAARWYLAPDEEGPRERRLERLLDEADAQVERQAKVVADERREEERRKAERERADNERYARQSEEREQVAEFLRTHGPATEKEIAVATGLSPFAVRHATDGLAKLGRDRKYSLSRTTP